MTAMRAMLAIGAIGMMVSAETQASMSPDVDCAG